MNDGAHYTTATTTRALEMLHIYLCRTKLQHFNIVLTTFHLHEMDQSPSISSVTPLLIWSEICLATVILAFLEYAFILYFMRFDKEIKNNTRRIGGNSKICEKRGGINAGRNDGKSDENAGAGKYKIANEQMTTEITDLKREELHSQRATIIDYYALRIIPFSFLVTLTIYFIIFSIQHS